MQAPSRQRGAVLFVALIMLVVFTLLAVSGVNSSVASLRVAGNTQSQTEVSAAAQLALEQVVDQVSNFQHPTDTPPPAQSISVSIAGLTYPVNVTLHCLGSAPVAGYSASFAASAPSESYWDIRASASDPRSGGSAVVHQGVKVTLSPGQLCPT
jgi:Tfp pilus assembly protein PilX